MHCQFTIKLINLPMKAPQYVDICLQQKQILFYLFIFLIQNSSTTNSTTIATQNYKKIITFNFVFLLISRGYLNFKPAFFLFLLLGLIQWLVHSKLKSLNI